MFPTAGLTRRKIDVEEKALKGDVLKAGYTGFQIKANSAFHPWKKTHIKDELFRKQKVTSKENLGESVRRCLDSKGRYVLVSTRVELTEPQRRVAITHIRELFAACGYKRARVQVWGQNQIIGLLRRFPSLQLKVNNRDHIHFRVHRM